MQEDEFVVGHRPNVSLLKKSLTVLLFLELPYFTTEPAAEEFLLLAFST
jgi:hypothetical protein